jgi:hypothetical protein
MYASSWAGLHVGGSGSPSAPLHIEGIDTPMNNEYGSLLITTGNANNRFIIGTRLDSGNMRYGYIQVTHSGTATKPLCLNANGGYVGVGVYNVAAPLTIGGIDNAYDSGIGTIRIETGDDTNKLVIGTKLDAGNMFYGYIQAQDSGTAKPLYLNAISGEGSTLWTNYDNEHSQLIPPSLTSLGIINGNQNINMRRTAYQFTPNGNVTFSATGGKAGRRCTFIIYTSGTTSRTITFSGNFRANGTIASGTVDGKYRTITFVCANDDVTWTEVSRQATSV